MRTLALLAVLAVVTPAAAQVSPTPDPYRPLTQLEVDRLYRQRLDTDAELQRQAAELHALETQALRNDLRLDQLNAEDVRRRLDQSRPLSPAGRARAAEQVAADIGQIDDFLDGARSTETRPPR